MERLLALTFRLRPAFVVFNFLSRIARQRRARKTGEPTPSEVVGSIQVYEQRVKSPTSSALKDMGTFGSPVFILSTGWRTGSTLLQRIIMTDPSILIFGESLGRASVIPRMTTAFIAITHGFPDPKEELRYGYDTSFWPANLYPSLTDFRRALRNLLLTWFAEPAKRMGYERWGLKEVRLSAADACLLKWLFPDAKFIVITRHPFDVYVSSRDFELWYRWPDRPTDGGRGVIRHWNWTASSWAALPDNWGHRVLKYEEMTPEYNWDDFGSMLDLKLSPLKALEKKTGSTKNKRRLGLLEKFIVNRLAREGMNTMGYRTKSHQ
jgi:hypothetical protein